MFGRKTLVIPSRDQALPGRADALHVGDRHLVLGHPLRPPFAPNLKGAVFAMGCFWGAERLFWRQPGVYTTAVGYAGGYTENATYEEVCTGRTGHTQVVLIAYDEQIVSYSTLLRIFWQSHDPTQGMRQGADIGTQYRSAIYCSDDAQFDEAASTRDEYQTLLTAKRFPKITTEIALAPPFYYAEDYHQQYLAKKPDGYCGLGACGVSFNAAELLLGEPA